MHKYVFKNIFCILTSCMCHKAANRFIFLMLNPWKWSPTLKKSRKNVGVTSPPEHHVAPSNIVTSPPVIPPNKFTEGVTELKWHISKRRFRTHEYLHKLCGSLTEGTEWHTHYPSVTCHRKHQSGYDESAQSYQQDSVALCDRFGTVNSFTSQDSVTCIHVLWNMFK